MVQAGGATTSRHQIHRKVQKGFHILFETNETNQAGDFFKFHKDIHILRVGFASGDGAENIQILDAHGPELGEMGFERGEDLFGFGHGSGVSPRFFVVYLEVGESR